MATHGKIVTIKMMSGFCCPSVKQKHHLTGFEKNKTDHKILQSKKSVIQTWIFRYLLKWPSKLYECLLKSESIRVPKFGSIQLSDQGTAKEIWYLTIWNSRYLTTQEKPGSFAIYLLSWQKPSLFAFRPWARMKPNQPLGWDETKSLNHHPKNGGKGVSLGWGNWFVASLGPQDSTVYYAQLKFLNCW